MSRPFTGVSPMAATLRGLVMCEPHQADWWVPVLNGKPVKQPGTNLASRYRTKREAAEALLIAQARRAPMPRAYRLGKRMGEAK